MKKYLFILLLTIAGYGQTYQNPTFGTIKTKTAPTVITTPHLAAISATGVVGKIDPVNLPWALDSNVLHKTGDETKTGVLTLSDQLILGEVSGSPQELWKLPANSLLKYNNLQTNQYGFNITTAGADSFFWVNDEGFSRQCMLYADGDTSGTDSDIFGLSASQDSGVSYVKNFSVTQGGGVYIRKLLNINNATASTIASFDASKNLVSLSTATYPSLTELSYVKGVTSSLQTQLNTKISGSASNGQVSFWNGTSSQTGDSGLIWDNVNKRLGVGVAAPMFRLDVRDTNGGTFFDGANATYNRWKSFGTSSVTGKALLISAQSSGTTPDVYIHASGGVSIGNTTDPGATNLSVTGDIIDAKLTGNPTAPTPTAGDNDTSIATTAFVTGAITTDKPYKVYTAILTQTGTSAPVATVLQNTTNTTITWTRGATGDYHATPSIGGFFTANKTAVFVNRGSTSTNNDVSTGWVWSSASNVRILTYNNGVLTDSCLSDGTVEIRVYP